jgi:hypothetical protein
MRRLALVLGLGAFLACVAPAWGNTYLAPCVGGGIRTLLAAGNAGGEALVSWQETREASGQTCASSFAEAAVGSTSAGFAGMGAISEPGVLSRPTGVFLDGAGDGWIVGVHEIFSPGENRYGPVYGDSGAWLAFRPAGGAFRAPVALPVGSTGADPFIAGDQAGAVVVGWNAGRGAYLAWGSSSGALSEPRFYGGGLSVSAVGVDEAGQALIAGYFPGKEQGARSVFLITGSAGSFSRPRILARVPRSPRRQQFPSILGAPSMGLGPNGQAVIAWNYDRYPASNGGYEMLAYRYADGRITKPVRFTRYTLFRESKTIGSGEPSTVTVNAAGQATIVTSDSQGLHELTIAPDGRFGASRLLTSQEVFGVDLTGNAAGDTALAWQTHNTIEFTLADSLAGFGAPQAITPAPGTNDFEQLVTIGENGQATDIWISAAKLPAREDTIEAQALTRGAPAIQIAQSQPSS